MRKILIISAIWLGLAAQFTTLAGQTALAGQYDRSGQGQRGNRAGAINPDYYTHKKFYRHEREPNGHVTCDAPGSGLQSPRACRSVRYCDASRQVCPVLVHI
jgi:hypothetical protein